MWFTFSWITPFVLVCFNIVRSQLRLFFLWPANVLTEKKNPSKYVHINIKLNSKILFLFFWPFDILYPCFIEQALMYHVSTSWLNLEFALNCFQISLWQELCSCSMVWRQSEQLGRFVVMHIYPRVLIVSAGNFCSYKFQVSLSSEICLAYGYCFTFVHRASRGVIKIQMGISFVYASFPFGIDKSL